MEFIKYIILGLIQGITEPLPISSSGHIFLFKNLFNTDIFNGLNFEIISNFASFLAILFIFRKDVWKLIKDKALLPEYTDKNASSIANKSPVWTFVLTALLPGIAALVQILMPLSEII